VGKGEGERGEGGRGNGGKRREARRERGKAGMGVDPTKFGKKSMSVFIGLYHFEYKNNRPIASRLQRVPLPTSFKIEKLLWHGPTFAPPPLG